YAAAMSSVTSQIALARKRIGAGMKLAHTARSQSGLLRQLASAYRDAGFALSRTSPPPQVRGVHSRLEAALANATGAYTRFSDATLRGGQAESRAAGSAREASAAVDAAFAALAPLGYRLR